MDLVSAARSPGQGEILPMSRCGLFHVNVILATQYRRLLHKEHPDAQPDR